MCAAFGDDDVGKTVVNASGEEVGMVTAVEHGTARINPDPGLTDSIKAALGWEDTGDDTYPLQEDAIDRITGDEIHLSGELHGDTTAGTMDQDVSSGRDAGTSTESAETGRRDDSESTPEDRTGRGDATGDHGGRDRGSELGAEESMGTETGPVGDVDQRERSDSDDRTNRSVPERDVAGGRTESSGSGGPDDRPMDDDPGTTDAGLSGSERSDRGRSSSSAHRGSEGEAMDPDVGDGDRVGGTDDELTDAEREVRDRDTDSDSDDDRGLHDRDTDSDSDSDRS
ncbi:hypothetical protein [Halovivax cerinus]|uniref:PRC-barrel domain-containing protein n=1 Tax=Halovivax cerinus TaxID=1487865 RepID=A0ABD5NT60_9EURY|nr:hypothetical protein [Halovivax cerinus]